MGTNGTPNFECSRRGSNIPYPIGIYKSAPPNPYANSAKVYFDLDPDNKRRCIGKLGGLRRAENLRQNPRPVVVKDQELEAIAQVRDRGVSLD